MSESVQTSASHKVPLRTRLGFGVGDFGFLLVWQGTSLFLMYFYTDVLGISPVIAGFIYLAAMIWDAATDPVIASVAERTRTRWGRYRPWIAIGAIPFGLSYALAFYTPSDSLIAPWLWALATHLLLRTTYTVVSMPFNAMPARLTKDADERSVLSGIRMIGAASGALVVSYITPVLVESYSGEGEARGFFIAAIIVGALASLGLIYCAFAMREPGEDKDSEPKSTLLADIIAIPSLLTSNSPLVRVFAVIIIGSIGLGMFGQNVLYHFKYDVGREDLSALALVLPALLLIFASPVWVIFSKRTSKKRALSYGMWIAFVGYAGFFINPTQFLPGAFFSIALTGIGGAALPVMFWSMLTDTIEYGELQTGTRAEARTFGFATFAQKAAVGINALLFGFLLSWSGFEANQAQSDGTLVAMKGIMALIPAIGALSIVLIVRDYELDSSTHAEIVRQIDANKKLAKRTGA